jgi:hypothetical protein
MTHPLDVHVDPWHWMLIRDDENATIVNEYTDAGHANFSEEIKHPIKTIVLIPQRPDLKHVVLLVPEDARPIVFRSRQAVLINDPDGPIPEHNRITGIGWQKTIDGRNHQTLVALYDDGSIVLTDDRQRV